MTSSDLRLDDCHALVGMIDAYVTGETDLTGLELYYELERSTSLLEFHTMLRGGPRNRASSGLQQSYGDHNRLLMLGLDRLVAGDLDWYRTRVDPDDPVLDDDLRRCFDGVTALELSRDVLVAVWLAAALHDCGMLCGRGAYVDVEDGVVLAQPIIDALGPEHLRRLTRFVLRHHDYVKGAFLGEVPAALVADDLAALPPEQRAIGLAALGCVQVAGAASLGEGRLGALRVEIFDRCLDGTALDDRRVSTRRERLLGAAATAATTATLDRMLDAAAVHGWQRVTADLDVATKTEVLRALADCWAASGADHVVFADSTAPMATASDAALGRLPHHVETTLSGLAVLVLGA